MSEYIVGDEVFFRYNEVLPCVSGEVEEIIEKPDKVYIKIKWKNYGEGMSHIPEEDVFKTQAECEDFNKKIKSKKLRTSKINLKIQKT